MAENVFPFIEPNAQEVISLPVLREIAWDFTRDCAIFQNGAPVYVERQEAVKVWVWKALHTPRFGYEIFTAAYGHDFDKLIGSSWSEELKAAEARQYLTEALTACPYIRAVRDIVLTFADCTLTAAFTIESMYDTQNMEVAINV